LGRPVDLFVEDDESDPATAAAVTAKLIKEKRVSVMIGPSLTASALAMAPVCEQEQVPLIVTGPAEVPFEKWVFLLGAGEARGAEHIAEFAVKTLKAKRIGVLHDTSDYGTSGSKVLVGSLGSYPGVSVIIEEQFGLSDTRLAPQLSRIKSANPDLLILYTNGASAAIIANEYKQIGMSTPVLGSHGVSTREFLALAGKTAQEYGWVMIGSKITIAGQLSPEDPFRRDLYDPFRMLLKKKYGPSAEPSEYQAAAYDGIMVALAAIKAADSDDRVAIRSALERIRWEGFVGAFACTSHDHQGSPRDDSPPMVVKNGEYVPYKR
jgi:branched-chain amino acid transport system substrate-binding protein